MNDEKIIKMKKLISAQLENRQLAFLEKQKQELENMIKNELKQGKIREEEYDILIEYIDNKVNEILGKLKESNISKEEKDFIREFKEKVIGRISFLTKEEAYQILKDYSEKHELFKEPVQQIIEEARISKEEEFRKRIVLDKPQETTINIKGNNDTKGLRVLEVRNGKISDIEVRNNEIGVTKVVNDEDKKRKLDLIDITSKRTEDGINKKEKAYDGSIINIELKEQEDKGEEK